MLSKTFEIRDKATFIPVLCTKLTSGLDRDRFLFSRAGFGVSWQDQKRYMVTVKLQTMEAHYDWPQFPRTMKVAHDFINKNWNELNNGDVIDVEFILGESEQPKETEEVK